MKVVEEYRNAPDLQGQVFEYQLLQNHEGTRWEVSCWQVPEDEKDLDAWDHRWSVNGAHYDNPKTPYGIDPIWKSFDEAAARKEFERWRA